MRGSAGPGDDEQGKWVSMDEWRERRRGRKMDRGGKEQRGAKEGTGRCPFGLLQVARSQLGPWRITGAGVKIWGLIKGGGLRGQQRSRTGAAAVATSTEVTEDNSSAPSMEKVGIY